MIGHERYLRQGLGPHEGDEIVELGCIQTRARPEEEVLVGFCLPQLGPFHEHVLGGAGVKFGIAGKDASCEGMVALNVEPRLVGNKKSLDDFHTASQAHRLLSQR